MHGTSSRGPEDRHDIDIDLSRTRVWHVQALSPDSLPLDDVGAAVSAAQERLQLSPWDACSRSAALDPGQLSERACSARQRSLEVRLRLTAAADERALRSLLPPSAVPLFAAQASSEVSDMRQDALLQVSTLPR